MAEVLGIELGGGDEHITSHCLTRKSRDAVVSNVPSQNGFTRSPWLSVLQPHQPAPESQPWARAQLELKLATQDSPAFGPTPVSVFLPLQERSVLIKLSAVSNPEYFPHFPDMGRSLGSPHPGNHTFPCWNRTHFLSPSLNLQPGEFLLPTATKFSFDVYLYRGIYYMQTCSTNISIRLPFHFNTVFSWRQGPYLSTAIAVYQVHNIMLTFLHEFSQNI